MIKKYYKIVKTYFSLGANNKKLLFHLFFSSLSKTLALLLIPLIASLIVDSATNNQFVLTVSYAIIFLISALIYIFFHHYNFTAYCKNSVYTHNKLQELILKKVTNYDENFTKDLSPSFIVNTAFNDVGNVMQVPDELFGAITKFLSICITLIILFFVHPFIGITIIFFNVISLLYLNYNLDKREYYLNYQRKYEDNISSLIGQVLDGNKEIKSFNMKNDLLTYLDGYKKLWKSHFFKKRKYSDYAAVLAPAILALGKLFILAFLIFLILSGDLNVAILILVIGYYDSIQNDFWDLMECLDALAVNATRVNRIYKILNYKTKNMLTFGSHNNDFIKGKIRFDKVSFTYEKQLVMKNISFTIEPNCFTAIVGKSGSGKSTIFRLLLRLYKAEKGCIYLDDEEISHYTKEVYASNVSIVTQKPFIFDMTISENFDLVNSDKEMQVNICKRLGIHDFITNLPNGYKTKLERDAENISSGQRQLIALARTLLSNAEVLLFDEVTSSLDLSTSKQIIDIFKDLKKDHTILMITHKPALMKMADNILVIDSGKLVGKGTHKELLEKNKYYQNLQK